MLLAIDTGNTETVIGLIGAEPEDVSEQALGIARGTGEHGLKYHWRLSTIPDRTPDELAVVLTQLLGLEGLDLRRTVTAIAVSSSVGAISPGVAISLDALYSHAAALRSVELVEPRSVIGRSTVESIQSGVLYGFAAQVDGMVERIWREVGESRVIATGGLAGLIAPRTQHVKFVEPWLTLHGLRIVHERNHAGDHA